MVGREERGGRREGEEGRVSNVELRLWKKKGKAEGERGMSREQ